MPAKKKLARGAAAFGHSAVGSGAKASGEDEKGKGSFRFWTDARRFKGSEDKCIVQQALYESGGVRIGGYPKASPVPGPLGCQRPGDWDLLWSPARLALKALPVKPGQLVSACPGMMSITRKRKLSLTLKEALGEDAFQIMPRTFSLPDELDAWRRHVASTTTAGQEDSDSDGPGPSGNGSSPQAQEQPLWILKTAQHLGKGLKLLPADQAVAEAARRRGKSKSEKPYVQAQQYVSDPLLIQGRKSGIRVWVLVTGHNPLRSYLHKNGLVLFSTHRYNTEEWSTAGGDVALGHVTNYAQNQDGMVWDLSQLQQHLGDSAFKTLWERIARNTALVCSAALPHIRSQHQTMGALPGSTFELLGLDFLVDSNLHPWLLEVNGTPSLAVEHENPEVEQLIHEQKMGMVRDMVALLNVRERFAPRYAAMRLALATRQQQAGAAVAAAGSSLNNALVSSSDTDQGVDDDADDDASDDGTAGEDAAGASGKREHGAAGAAAGAAAEGESDGMVVDEEEAGEGGVATASGVTNNNAGGGVGVGEGGAAATAAAGLLGPAARTALARKRLREAMSPTSDAMVWARVRQELQQRGGFAPLMGLFPVKGRKAAAVVPGPVRPPAGSNGSGISWDARDVEMAALMKAAGSAGGKAGARRAPAAGPQ